MREDPNHDPNLISTCLATDYDIQVAAITFLPIGFDYNAAVYDVTATDGTDYFLKIRTGPVAVSNLQIPRALTDLGIPNILSPLPTRSGALWSSLDAADALVILYPFIRGTNAKRVGLSDEQWRVFGATLRAVHDSGLHERFGDQLPRETFALPSAALVRRMIALPESVRVESAVADEFWVLWERRSWQIEEMLTHVEEIGRQLQSRSFSSVLCHSDIHTANILLGEDDRIWLVDWDDPLIAPRERDLLFVVGGRIGRIVEPREEDLFFDGYGPTTVDPLALIYYRYERTIEDLGEMARHILLDPTDSETSRATDAALAMSLFDPGGNIDLAEFVTRTRWPADAD